MSDSGGNSIGSLLIGIRLENEALRADVDKVRADLKAIGHEAQTTGTHLEEMGHKGHISHRLIVTSSREALMGLNMLAGETKGVAGEFTKLAIGPLRGFFMGGALGAAIGLVGAAMAAFGEESERAAKAAEKAAEVRKKAIEKEEKEYDNLIDKVKELHREEEARTRGTSVKTLKLEEQAGSIKTIEERAYKEAKAYADAWAFRIAKEKARQDAESTKTGKPIPKAEQEGLQEWIDKLAEAQKVALEAEKKLNEVTRGSDELIQASLKEEKEARDKVAEGIRKEIELLEAKGEYEKEVTKIHQEQAEALAKPGAPVDLINERAKLELQKAGEKEWDRIAKLQETADKEEETSAKERHKAFEEWMADIEKVAEDQQKIHEKSGEIVEKYENEARLAGEIDDTTRDIVIWQQAFSDAIARGTTELDAMAEADAALALAQAKRRAAALKESKDAVEAAIKLSKTEQEQTDKANKNLMREILLMQARNDKERDLLRIKFQVEDMQEKHLDPNLVAQFNALSIAGVEAGKDAGKETGKSFLEGFQSTFAQGIESLLMDVFETGGRNASQIFQDIMKQMLRQVMSSIIQSGITQLLGSLVGGIGGGGGGGGIGSVVSMVAGLAGGGGGGTAGDIASGAAGIAGCDT